LPSDLPLLSLLHLFIGQRPGAMHVHCDDGWMPIVEGIWSKGSVRPQPPVTPRLRIVQQQTVLKPCFLVVSLSIAA